MKQRTQIKLVTFLRYITGIPRSIYVNFRLLPFSEAIKLPILVSRKTHIRSLSGTATIKAEKRKAGMIKFGLGFSQNSDFRYDRVLLEIRGNCCFEGNCKFGTGSKISIEEGASVVFGDNFNLGPNSLLLCRKKIVFGNTVRTSWNCTIMDTDQHDIADEAGRIVNPDREIVFGDRVWIGCNTTILKGVTIPDDTIIGACTCVRHSFAESKTIIAGENPEVIKRGVTRVW